MAKAKSEKLTLKHIVGYGCGDCGGTMTLYMVSGYISRYMQVHLGVNAGILATILLLWNLWDAINDPLMGTLIDVMFAKTAKKNPNADRCRPWILRSIPVMAVGMIAFYNVPRMLDGWALIGAAFILKIIYEAGYTMMNIGMGSLLGNMATNDNERATLSSARGFGSTVAGFLGGAIIPLCVGYFGDSAEGYGITAIVICAIAMVIVFLHYALTEERTKVVVNTEKTPEEEEASKVKVTDILVTFKKNRAFLALVLHSICICFVQGLGQGANSYMYADVLKNISIQAIGSTMSTVLMIVILSAAPILTKKWDLVAIIRVCLISGAIGFGLLLAYCLKDVENINPMVYVVMQSLSNGLITMSVQMQWGLVAEAIDYNEYLTGKRGEGSIYGMFSFSRRLGSMLASSAAVLVIDGIGYDVAATAAGLDQTVGVKTGLTLMCVAFPIVAAVGSFCCFTFIWNINADVRKKMADWRAAKAAK